MRTKSKITVRDLQRTVNQTQAALSTAEFSERIARIVGPAPRQDKPCVRTPEDRGYYAPPRMSKAEIATHKRRIEAELAGATARFSIGENIDLMARVKVESADDNTASLSETEGGAR